MFTVEMGGYQVTFEKVGKAWRAQVNGKTVCSCTTKRATMDNARYLCRNLMPETRKALFGS